MARPRHSRRAVVAGDLSGPSDPLPHPPPRHPAVAPPVEQDRIDGDVHIEGCDAVAVERLLRRLTRHGDRIFVSIGETLREIVDVDWSAFQLAVAPSSR